MHRHSTKLGCQIQTKFSIKCWWREQCRFVLFICLATKELQPRLASPVWRSLYKNKILKVVIFFFFFLIHLVFYFTILYWFCHTLTWICHGCTCVPHPEPPSHLPPHTIPLGHPSAPAPSTLYHALNLDWQFISHMIIHMFQCHSPISSCPHPSRQSPKDYSIHLCLFCRLAYRVIVTIFLNSIYMH